MTLPPAGWYADDDDPTALRWWNGQQWTAHLQRDASPIAASRQPSGHGAGQSSYARPARVHDPAGGYVMGGKNGGHFLMGATAPAFRVASASAMGRAMANSRGKRASIGRAPIVVGILSAVFIIVAAVAIQVTGIF